MANTMGKADSMIMLMTLYNRIEETGLSKTEINRTFTSKVNKLEKAGHVTPEDAKFALAYLVPEVLTQEINKIKNAAIATERAKMEKEVSAAKSVKTGYSKTANVDRINSFLDDVMKNDNVKAWEPPQPKDVDPCFRSSYRTSSC